MPCLSVLQDERLKTDMHRASADVKAASDMLVASVGRLQELGATGDFRSEQRKLIEAAKGTAHRVASASHPRGSSHTSVLR